MTAVENRVTPIASVEVYGREIKPTVGGLVLIGDRLCSELLKQGDDTVDSGYRGSQFRIDVLGGSETRPVDIEITGRTIQRRPYQQGFWIKINIVWVGDCEPDTRSAGWLFVA